jgi:hypothetical protein
MFFSKSHKKRKQHFQQLLNNNSTLLLKNNKQLKAVVSKYQVLTKKVPFLISF